MKKVKKYQKNLQTIFSESMRDPDLKFYTPLESFTGKIYMQNFI